MQDVILFTLGIMEKGLHIHSGALKYRVIFPVPFFSFVHFEHCNNKDKHIGWAIFRDQSFLNAVKLKHVVSFHCKMAKIREQLWELSQSQT